ncbi:hypothetical protein [Streptomyces violascens]|uniref:hypothetical protein n=1 Tax=Streptomyces violascens TaxID=67381 RepID=UPI0016758B43|nr:hypothetical protein [Streptomyces violascens]GGU40332.1 hypothetical protein GCM10010289_71420 [Streptomyces violascens]
MARNLPRLIPTGKCFCGCGNDVGLGSFFARGHDKVAEAALIAVEYGGSVAQMLHAKGFSPSHSVVHKAVGDAGWEYCEPCDYYGAPASMRNHEKKAHREK